MLRHISREGIFYVIVPKVVHHKNLRRITYVGNVLEEILKDNFVVYTKVYELAALKGITKKQVRLAKEMLGVKTITLVNGDERLWLWYIPDNVWRKYSV